ncbi:MAG: NfeD family protein [Alphaproteobacteria bacterium]|nr:NfeD family protein [Alphaproteobacteria bacterium]
MSFDDLAFWHWFALAAVFIAIEIFVPGIAFLWLGIAGLVTGAVLFFFPSIGIAIQGIIFAVVAVITTVAARLLIRRTSRPSDRPGLNQRGHSHVGSVYLLVGDTKNGHGKVHIGDTVWSVQLSPGSGEIPAGSSVRVVDVNGATLVVESFASAPATDGSEAVPH